MRWLLFLSRLAFICGIFFLLTVSLQINNWSQDETITQTIIFIGYVFGLLMVPIINICYLVVLMVKKTLWPVPLWLSLCNLLFLILQFIYIFYLNG
jgi:hypothetical protein